MADKIYNRQGQNLSTHSPVTPKLDTGLSEMLSDRAQQSAQVAAESFALGQKQVLNGIMDYGYKEAQANPKQFLELTQSAFDKQVQGLPENMRKKMTENFLNTQRNYLLKVENNFIDKQDAQLKQQGEETLYSLSQNMQLANENLYKSLASGRYEDVKLARQELDNLKRQGIAQSEIKLSNGSYVYSKSDREKIKNGNLYNPQLDFELAIDDMSLEKLREWDKEIFQNQQTWIQETGIDKKAYKAQSKYVQDRLKALGDTEKRILKSNAEFVAAELIPNFDPDKLSELKKQGLVNSDLLSAIEEANSKPMSVSGVISASKFAETLKSLQPVIMDTDDSDQANERRLQATTILLKNYRNFAEQNGLSVEEQQDYLNLISKGIVDKQFSESLQPIFTNSALNESLNDQSNYDDVYKAMEAGYGGEYRPKQAPKEPKRTYTAEENQRIMAEGMAGVITGQEEKLMPEMQKTYAGNIQKIADDYAKRNARTVANDYVKTAISLSVAGEYEEAKKILEQGNREVIKTRSAPYLSKEEFNRLERELADSKKAYFTKSDGSTYEFLGYSNKDAIFKVVK